MFSAMLFPRFHRCAPPLPTLLAVFFLSTLAVFAQEPTAPIPGVEPSIRERARTVIESDREFLREVESGTAPEAPRATPARVRRSTPAPKPPAPIAARPQPAGERNPEPRRAAATPAVSANEPAAERPPAPQIRHAPAGAGRAAVQRFVREFIAASEGPTPDGELALYAPRVRYFDSGPLSRESIAKDQRKYYQRWPKREFTLVGEPEIIREDGDSVTVRYRLRYRLRHGEDSASGQTEHILSLQNGDHGLKIVAIRERKVD
jgi:hypothetical protein